MVKTIFLLFTLFVLILSVKNISSELVPGECAYFDKTECDHDTCSQCTNPADHCSNPYWYSYSDPYGYCKEYECYTDFPSFECATACGAECQPDSIGEPGSYCLAGCSWSSYPFVPSLCAVLDEDYELFDCSYKEEGGEYENDWPASLCLEYWDPNFVGGCVASHGGLRDEGCPAGHECLWVEWERPDQPEWCIGAEELRGYGITCVPIGSGWGTFVDADIHQLVCEDSLYGSLNWKWIRSGEDHVFGEYEVVDTTPECCGDDEGEKIVYGAGGMTKCCDESEGYKVLDLQGNCIAQPIPACPSHDDTSETCCRNDIYNGNWFTGTLDAPYNNQPCCSAYDGYRIENSFDYLQETSEESCCFMGGVLEHGSKSSDLVNGLDRFYCLDGNTYVCTDLATYNSDLTKWDFATPIEPGQSVKEGINMCCRQNQTTGNYYFDLCQEGPPVIPDNCECTRKSYGCGGSCDPDERLYYSECRGPGCQDGIFYYECVEETSCCEIESVKWTNPLFDEEISKVLDESYVRLFIDGSLGCANKEFQLEIYEKDAGEDNPIGFGGEVGFNDLGFLEDYWVASFEDDGYGNPEYYFTAIFQSAWLPPYKIEAESGELEVYKDPCFVFWRYGSQKRSCSETDTPGPNSECENFKPITERGCGDGEIPFPGYGLVGVVLTVFILVGYYVYRNRKKR